jgi:hypothetical protein
LQDPPKFTQISIFGFKKYHLATLDVKRYFKESSRRMYLLRPPPQVGEVAQRVDDDTAEEGDEDEDEDGERPDVVAMVHVVDVGAEQLKNVNLFLQVFVLFTIFGEFIALTPGIDFGGIFLNFIYTRTTTKQGTDLY